MIGLSSIDDWTTSCTEYNVVYSAGLQMWHAVERKRVSSYSFIRVGLIITYLLAYLLQRSRQAVAG